MVTILLLITLQSTHHPLLLSIPHDTQCHAAHPKNYIHPRTSLKQKLFNIAYTNHINVSTI